MAERSEEACQVLLDKLKQGQVNLHRNLQHLRPNSDAAAEEPRPLRVTHVRYKRGGGDSLCCTKHLPVRRARTEQLSPATPPSHPPRRKYRKRLSSTPKHSSPPLSPPLIPHSHFSPSSHPPFSTSDDIVSLENALLSHPSLSKTHKPHKKTNTGMIETEGKRKSVSTSAKRKGISTNSVTGTTSVVVGKERPDIVKGTKQEVSGNSVSRVVGQSTSVRGRYDHSGKGKKPRGLTVSFVANENSPSSSKIERKSRSGGGVGLGSKRRSGELSFSEEKERGERLINSLNSSRFGALEHSRRSKLSTTSKTPRVADRPGGGRGWRVGEEERLGYDWIAGLVEAGSLLEDREEEWFQEMREFRKINHSECSRPHPVFLPDIEDGSQDSPTTPPHNLTSSHSTTGHTHCTQSYVLNDRLFPMSQRQGGGRRCPVCEGKREKGEDDHRSIHYIRVSVPRRSVQAPYQLRPHRRRSFDPSDSMALNKSTRHEIGSETTDNLSEDNPHCLAGWNSTKPPSLPPQTTVDLQSHLTAPHPSPAPHSHTSHKAPLTLHHSSPSVKAHRGRKIIDRSVVSSNLLDTSLRAEYSLRSRGHHS